MTNFATDVRHCALHCFSPTKRGTTNTSYCWTIICQWIQMISHTVYSSVCVLGEKGLKFKKEKKKWKLDLRWKLPVREQNETERCNLAVGKEMTTDGRSDIEDALKCWVKSLPCCWGPWRKSLPEICHLWSDAQSVFTVKLHQQSKYLISTWNFPYKVSVWGFWRKVWLPEGHIWAMLLL